MITGAVKGVASKLTEKAWESGQKVLSTRYKDHQAKAIEKAEQNALDFLAQLAQRVTQLEDAADDPERMKQRILSALEDPDFSILLHDALIDSARTEDRDIHKVMARMVSERLRSESRDMLALTVPLACHALKSLTPTHLRFLATGSVLEVILPCEVSAVHSKELRLQPIDWVQTNLAPVLPSQEITEPDMLHLMGLACVYYLKLEVCDSDVFGFMKRNFKVDVTLDAALARAVADFFDNTDAGKRLLSCWDGNLSNLVLTTPGKLIGLCVFDELTGQRTDLQS
jgi:Fe-S-cluster formation regulator IscX/YfhJ